MEPVTGSIFILPFSPSGTLPFPSVFAPSHYNRTDHTSHDAQNSCHQILRQLREKCIPTQREKYSGKKIKTFNRSVSNCFFSLAGKVSRPINSLTALTIPCTGFIFFLSNKHIDSATTLSRPGKQNNNRRVPSAPAYAPPKNTLLYHSG